MQNPTVAESPVQPGFSLRKFIPRLNLVSRLTLMGVVTMSFAVGVSIWTSVTITGDEMYRRAQSNLDINIKLLDSILTGYGAPTLKGEELYFGTTLINNNFAAVDRVKSIAGGTATVFRGDTRVSTNVAKPDGSRAVGTQLAAGPAYDTVFKNRQTYRGEANILGEPYLTVYQPIMSGNEVLGIAYVGVKRAEFFDVLRELVNMNILAGLCVIALAGLAMLFLVRQIFAPIHSIRHELVGMAEAASQGWSETRPRDEIGEMRAAVSELGKAAKAKAIAEEEAAKLRQRADAQRRRRDEERARAADERARVVKERTGAMEEISSTVKENAAKAIEADQVANGTCSVADRSGQIVSQAVEAMSRIEESSRKIADIIAVIDEIARQTNLLALNAAVEAARAGEAGRGFAVVATEVRSLAQRSSQAAKDINALISNSSVRVQEGVALVNKAGGSLAEILDSIRKVAAIVSGIASASSAQATGLEEINRTLTQLDEGIYDHLADKDDAFADKDAAEMAA